METNPRQSEQRGPSSFPRSVGVLGGGTAGYFAALALQRRFPALDVCVVESSSIPIIGVGEATTTVMPPFLHGQLGLDVAELYRTVRPSFKLGIKFEWGLPGDYHFNYPFGAADPIDAFALDNTLHNQSLISLLMNADRVPMLREDDGRVTSLLPRMKFAYHLDNEPFVRFLASAAARAGISHVDMTVETVVPRADGRGIEAVRGPDGRELRYDLYVDATGFRSLLLEKNLGSPFQSYASSLFCDRAVVAEVPQRGPLQPYTTAETMDAGWCWRIPVEGEDHRGYVHSSAHLSEAAAVAEMRAKNPGMGAHRVVHFRSGRHRDFWVGNTVAVGNAYGFVEPLESTALHMVIVEVAYLLAGLEAQLDPAKTATTSAAAAERGDYPAFASRAVGEHWDYLRWFLAVHYKFNHRLDTPFWRAARAEVDVSGLAPFLERFQREGPWITAEGRPYEVGDPAFGYSGLMMLLLGQRVAAPVSATGAVSREAWAQRVAQQRALVARALPQREALALLASDPALLREAAEAPTSWCQSDAERVSLLPHGGDRAHPKGNTPSVPGDALLRSVRR